MTSPPSFVRSYRFWPRRGECRSRIAVVLACASIAVVATEAPLVAQRRVVVAALGTGNMLWSFGGSDEELLRPNRITLIDSLLIVNDPSEPSIEAIDTRSGRLAWRYTKSGAGPYEINQPFLVSWHPRGIIVVDNQNRKVLLLSTGGEALAESPVPGGLYVAGLCALISGEMVIHVPSPDGSGLILFDFDNSPPRTLADPFAKNTLSMSERIVDLASTEGSGGRRCLAVRRLADGLATFQSAGAGRSGRYVERVTQRRIIPPQEIKDTSQLPIQFGLRGTVVGTSAVVRFGGKSRCAFKCYDFYSLATLDYTRTVQLDMQLPVRTRDVIIAPGRIYVLGTRGDYPVLMAFRIPSDVTP